MSWARLDDRYDDNRKIKRAWREHPRAVGLHAMAITYSARHETDGWVDAHWLHDCLPHPAERKKALAVLVACGLFERGADGDYRVHDYLDYNASRLARAEKAEAGRKAARARWHAGGNGNGNAGPDAERMRDPRKSQCPTPPIPSHTTERDSPNVCGRAGATGRALPLEPSTDELGQLAADVASILQGAVDGLTTEEACRRPGLPAVLAALQQRGADQSAALAAAWEARSIAQSQNRAPNIVALFAQRLEGAPL